MHNLDDINEAIVAPTVETTPRIQNIFMLVNTSRRIPTEKFNQLNEAMQDCVNDLKNISTNHPEIDFLFRLITFSDRAKWHPGQTSSNILEVKYPTLEAGGDSAEAGLAVKMLAEFIASKNFPRRIYPPIILLISDGHHTDGDAYEEAIKQIEKTPCGKKSIRLSAGIGADSNWKQLGKFANRRGIAQCSHTDDLAVFVLSAVRAMIITGGSHYCIADEPSSPIDLVLPPPPPSSPRTGNSLEIF